MEITRECISFTVVISSNGLQLCKSCSGAVACAILEGISGLEPSSEITAPRYLKLLQYPTSAILPLSHSGCHWHVCNQSGSHDTDLHFIHCAGFVETFY